MNNKYSYTSAGTYPIKVLKDIHVLSYTGKIRPRHLQLNITNKCNLNCNFCSCSGRDKEKSMSLVDVQEIANIYRSLGCVAITITGGGEPLLHPDFKEIVNILKEGGFKIGLVTNGDYLDKLKAFELERIDWIRVSFDDNRDFQKLSSVLDSVLEYKENQFPDFAFSYVLSSSPNLAKIKSVIEYANKHNFTHVRIVSDLLNLENCFDVHSLENILKNKIKLDDSKVIYQSRRQFTKGRERCLISLAKPVVDVDGKVYPCCGVQYAKKGTGAKYNSEMSMGNFQEANTKYVNQIHFDGSECTRCYYDSYNEVLELLTSRVEHSEFI